MVINDNLEVIKNVTMCRVKTDERIESDYNGSRRRQSPNLVKCKSRTGNKKKSSRRRKK